MSKKIDKRDDNGVQSKFSLRMREPKKIKYFNEEFIVDDPDETEFLLGTEGYKYRLEIKERLTSEEKKQIDNLPKIDIEKLVHLKQVYYDENLRNKKEIIYYKKSFYQYVELIKEMRKESGIENILPSFESLREQMRIRLNLARLRTARSGMFIEWIEHAIKNNIAFKDYDEKENGLLKQIEDAEKRNIELNRELMNAHSLLVKQKRKNQLPSLTPEEFRGVVDNSRKKNGAINYSKLGKVFGITHHTARRYCALYGIKD